MLDLKKIPIYPLLLAVYPVLFLFSYNIAETPLNEIYVPLLLSIIVSLLIWAIVFAVTKDLLRSALIVAVIQLFLFNYGRIYDLFTSINVSFAKHRYLIAIMILITGYACYFIMFIKNKNTKGNLTLTLNIVTSALIIINVVNISMFNINRVDKKHEVKEQSINLDISDKYDRPDIYLIIPDEYASVNTMKEVYEYDNSEFIKDLEDKGFYIANGKSKYIGTSSSIPSILNMNYLEQGSSSISDSKVQKYLESIGYKTTWFGIEAYYDSIWKIKASQYYNFYHNGMISEFEKVLIETTFIRPFYEYNLNKQYLDIYRSAINKSLSTFSSTINDPGPKLVILHLMSPHEPFIFDANGGEVSFDNRFNWNDKKYYRDQYIYITKRLTNLTNELISKTKGNAIILIQSDHGPRGGITENDSVTNWDIVPEGYRHEVFQAYYLPNNGASVMYKEISPVNLFRVIFDYYFKTKLGKLEDYKYNK